VLRKDAQKAGSPRLVGQGSFAPSLLQNRT